MCRMLELLDNFRLQDAVDIGIVAFIIYSLIELIRGTRAARMLIGLCVVVLIYLSSRLFDLYTLNWILDNFLSSVLLVIVIIFQHDIRRALVQVGSRPFFGADHRPARPGSRGDPARRGDAGQPAHRRADRLRARDRPQRVHRGRHDARRADQQGADPQHLPARLADPRRRADHPQGPHHRGGLLSAADRQPERQQDARHAPPRRHRHHRGERRGGDRRVRGGRRHLAGGRRAHHARPRRRHRCAARCRSCWSDDAGATACASVRPARRRRSRCAGCCCTTPASSCCRWSPPSACGSSSTPASATPSWRCRCRSSCATYRPTSCSSARASISSTWWCAARARCSTASIREQLSVALDLRGVRPGPAVFRIVGETLDLPRGVDVVRLTPSEVTLEFAATLRRARAGARRLHRQAARRPARHRHARSRRSRSRSSARPTRSEQIKAAETVPIDLADAPGRADRARPAARGAAASTSRSAPSLVHAQVRARGAGTHAHRGERAGRGAQQRRTAPRSAPATRADHRARTALGDGVA